jgi:hypothetical protein
MTGQLNPVPSDPTIVWRSIATDGPETYYLVVEEVRGTTKDDGWLYIFRGSDDAIVHRKAVVVKPSVVFGMSPEAIKDWEAEAIKAIMNPQYREIQGV